MLIFLTIFTTSQVNLGSSFCKSCREDRTPATSLQWCQKPWPAVKVVMRKDSDHGKCFRMSSLCK